ncbi:MAG: hypothetical protein ABI791_14175, partial [Acidobacteriota bacterium]
PGLTVIFQLALAVLVGGLGLVLATPLLAVIMVIVEMIYIQDILGDTDTDVNDSGVEERAEDDSRKIDPESTA